MEMYQQSHPFRKGGKELCCLYFPTHTNPVSHYTILSLQSDTGSHPSYSSRQNNTTTIFLLINCCRLFVESSISSRSSATMMKTNYYFFYYLPFGGGVIESCSCFNHKAYNTHCKLIFLPFTWIVFVPLTFVFFLH